MSPKSKGGRLAPGKQGGPAPPGPPWARTEKPRDFRGAMSRLMSYMGRYRYAIILGVLLSMAGAALTTIGPHYLQEIADTIYDGEHWLSDTDEITRLALIVVAIYLTAMVLSMMEHYIIPATSERVANMLRRDMDRKIDRLPLNYYDNSSTGDIMSRLTNDADTIGEQCGISLSVLFTASTVLAGCLIMMFVTCPVLAAISIVPPLAGFAASRVIIGRTHGLYVRQSRDMGAMNGLVEETYYGHDIMRAYNGEEKARREFVGINDDLYSSVWRSRFVSGSLPQIMNLVGNLNYVIVCTVGSMLVIDGQITYGVIVAFIVYVRMFSQPLLQLSDAFASMQSLAASSERVFDLLDAPEMEDESGKPWKTADTRGEVEFRDVDFSYIEGIQVIHGFSMTVRPGEKVAIVGPTGAGKTTVVNLLMRFYELDSGDILIDGVSTRRMRREDVHSMFSMVLQDSWLFDGTVRENIVYNREGVTDEEVREAADAVGIGQFIESLPKGYDTVIGDGAGISAGQKQQIAIARAMVRAAPMVIFDEATSSVDTRTEKRIQAAMDRLTAGRTSFIIAHRLSTIRDCDRIIVMRDGRIVETGTHQELLDRKGFYYGLYNSQFENCA